jgi:hypothetical protein
MSCAPLAVGHRVIMPHLRCFGPTVFRSPDVFLVSSQLSGGIIDLMDTLGIEQATLAGYEWAVVVHALPRHSGLSAFTLWFPPPDTPFRTPKRMRRSLPTSTLPADRTALDPAPIRLRMDRGSKSARIIQTAILPPIRLLRGYWRPSYNSMWVRSAVHRPLM